MKGEATSLSGFAFFCHWVDVLAPDLHYAEAAQGGGRHTGDAFDMVDVGLMIDIVLDYFVLLFGGIAIQKPVTVGAAI